MKTQLAKKLIAKGVVPRNVQLQLAIAKFQNDGGTYGVALAMLNAAYGKGSEGHPLRVAERGHGHDADASPSNDGEVGRYRCADKAGTTMPASPSTLTGRQDDPLAAADKVKRDVSLASRPGHAKRGLAAIAAAQTPLAKSLFDVTMLPDGRRLRDVRWDECPTLAKKYRRLSRILMAVHNHAIPPDPSTKLDAIVNEAKLEEIVQTVERFNEIH